MAYTKLLYTTLLSFCFMFSLTSCKQIVDDLDWKLPVVQFKDSVTFSSLREIKFHLDSSTILYYESCQFEDKTNSLVSYNSTTSELIFFDYNTRKLKRKINLTGLGIRRKPIGNIKSYSFNVINCDSIYFYDHGSATVVLFDTSSRILNKYSVKSDKNLYDKGSIVIGELLAVGNDSLYISSAPGRNPFSDKAPLLANSILSISLKTGVSQPIIKYPNIYKKARWGKYLHAFHLLYNNQNKKLVISYPIDHFLNVYDTIGKCTRYFAGGKEVELVKPWKYSGDNSMPKKDEDDKNFVSQKSYASILFDPFRSLYYRLITCPIPEEDFEKSKYPSYKKTKTMEIVILNAAFEKVGEVPIDSNKYTATSMFVSKDGLCIPLKSSNDDYLSFTVFAIRKNTK